MHFDEYANRTGATAIYPDRGCGSIYPYLGLAGETGEVCEKVKKVLRDHRGQFTIDDRKAVTKELGDVLWYLAACCYELGISLEEVVRVNLEKVEGRRARGTLGGSGDDR